MPIYNNGLLTEERVEEIIDQEEYWILKTTNFTAEIVEKYKVTGTTTVILPNGTPTDLGAPIEVYNANIAPATITINTLGGPLDAKIVLPGGTLVTSMQLAHKEIATFIFNGTNWEFDVDDEPGYLTSEALLISTDGQTVFTLSQQPDNPSLVLVTVNGAKYTYGADFTILGTTLTWQNVLFPLETTDCLEIYY